MKNRSHNNLDQQIRAHQRRLAARMGALQATGKPRGSVAARLRERVMASVARHFGGAR